MHAGTKVCFMADEDEARETVHRLWPNEGLPGELAQVLPTPSHFEQACELVTPDLLSPPMGPDLDAHARRCRSTRTPASTSCSSSRSAPSRTRSSRPGRSEILPRFG